jgi:hypothetical protein
MATQVSLNSGAVASAGALAIQTNGTTQAVSISTGQVATLAQNPILTSGTANGVAYLNGSKALTTGSAFTFDGTALASSGSGTQSLTVTSTATAAYLQTTGANTVNARLQSNSTNASVGTTSNHAFNIQTNATTVGTFDTSGNLGLGTTAPTTFSLGGKHLEVDGTSGGYAFVHSRTSTVRSFYATNESAGIAALFTFSNHPLTFGTNNTECGRFDTSGRFIASKAVNITGGTTFSGGIAGISYSAGSWQVTASLGVAGIVVGDSATSAGNTLFYFANSNGAVGSIATSGTATIYAVASDYRLKNIEGPLTGAKDFIMALQPRQGTWKTDGSKFVGFVAHEFQEVSPSSVMGEKDAVDESGNPKIQSMQASSSEVMANLVAFIQEQQALITQLQADVAALKGA